MNTIIENKGIFLSIMASDDNELIESAISTNADDVTQSAVMVYKFPTGDYAVLDRSMVGSYITYLAESIGKAMGIYRNCCEAIE